MTKPNENRHERKERLAGERYQPAEQTQEQMWSTPYGKMSESKLVSALNAVEIIPELGAAYKAEIKSHTRTFKLLRESCQQRDALLAACKAMVSLVDDLHGENLQSTTMDKSRAAIARAEGPATNVAVSPSKQEERAQ